MSLKREPVEIEICILAGGRSRRMGEDKSRIRLGRRTLLGHVRCAALDTGWPVRVIRGDPIPNCGPLGGILGALQSTRAGMAMFLACDMPLITGELMQRLAGRIRPEQAGLFTFHDGRYGFPCLLRRQAVQTVAELIRGKRDSLQELARELSAGRFVVNRQEAPLLRNANTPADIEAIRGEFEHRPAIVPAR
jgi:molybdopterin-guanine dinucleotide biosynthesis protein A